MAELIDKGAITFRCRYSGDCRGSIEACFKCRDYVCNFEDIQDTPTVTEAEIRNKAIEEVLEIVKRAYHSFGGFDLAFMQKYGNTTASQAHESYSTMMMYEIANEFDNLIDELEQLKGEQ